MSKSASKICRLFCMPMFAMLTLSANTVPLIEGEDYNYGNGKGAPVAEDIAGYAHKDDVLDYFSQRRTNAIREVYLREKPKLDLLKKFNITVGIVYPAKTNYDVLSMNPAYTSGAGEKIRFFTRSGLEKSQVFLVNGGFYHYDEVGKLVLYNSAPTKLDGVTGDIIVMDQRGNIFIHPKEMGFIHHSSFFSQKAIAFGAMVRIENGRLIKANRMIDRLKSVTLFPERVRGENFPRGLMYYSGHYDPHTGSLDIKKRVKQDALDSFKRELETRHFMPMAHFVRNSDVLSALEQLAWAQDEYDESDAAQLIYEMANTRHDEIGNPDAQFVLGLIYKNGLNEYWEKSETQAAHFFSRASFRCHSAAHYELGMVLRHGRGWEKEPIEAEFLFSRAKMRGDLRAEKALRDLTYDDAIR